MKQFLILIFFISLVNASEDNMYEQNKKRNEHKNQVLIKKVMEMKDSSVLKTKYYLQVVEDGGDLNIKNGIYNTRNIIGISKKPDTTHENIVMLVDIKNLDYQAFFDYTMFNTTFTNLKKIKCKTQDTANNPKECKSTFFTADLGSSTYESTKDTLLSLGTNLLTSGLSKVMSFDKKLFAQVIVDNEEIIKNLLFREIKKTALDHGSLQNKTIVSLRKKVKSYEDKNLELQKKLMNDTNAIFKKTEIEKEKSLNLQKSNSNLNAQVLNIKQSLKEKDKIIAQLKHSISKKLNTEKTLKAKYNDVQKSKEIFMNTNNTLNIENRTLFTKLNTSHQKLNELNKKYTAINNENKLLKDKIAKLGNSNTKQDNSELLTKIKQLQEKIKQLENEKNTFKKTTNDTSASLTKQTRKIKQLKNQLNELNKKNTAINNENKLLKDKIAKLGNSNTKQNSVLESKVENLQQKIMNFNNKNKALEKNISNLNIDNKNVKKENILLKDELNKLNVKINNNLNKSLNSIESINPN